VSPNDVSVLDQGADSVLTLVTCTPKFTASRRLIVRGQLDTSASAPVATAPPTTVPAGGPASTTAGGSATTVAPGGAAVTPTTLPSEGDQGGGNEGLVAGWGHDGAAWLQVLLWGLACSFVGAGATFVSRKRHDNWTGAMVGLLPFVVALWFFYENVARLLPPNL
jgi:sortase A